MINTQPKIKLRKGAYYYLINMSTQLALSMPSSQNYHKDAIIAQPLEPENINQVWMIEEIAHQTYEIVHAISTLVIENNNSSCKLQFGKQKASQIFKIKEIETDGDRIRLWFKEKGKGKSLKHLFWSSGGLRMMEIDYADKLCQWELLPVKKNDFIEKTSYISSFSSHYCLDVPQASERTEIQIIQYPCNYRFNQKWVIKRAGDYFFIMNAKTKLYLDIKGENHKEGTPIIQYTFHGNKNQQWKLEQQGKHVYLIRSAMDNQLLMSVKENSLKQAAEIVTSKYEVGSFWVITGFIPK